MTIPRDPHTFSEGTWALQAYINSLQSPSEKVLGSLGNPLTCPFSFWRTMLTPKRKSGTPLSSLLSKNLSQENLEKTDNKPKANELSLSRTNDGM